jgi:hypothetical protein
MLHLGKNRPAVSSRRGIAAGSRRTPIAAGLGASQGRARATSPTATAADRRQVRRTPCRISRRRIPPRCSSTKRPPEDLRGHAVLLPPARARLKGGDRARGQRLCWRRFPMEFAVGRSSFEGVAFSREAQKVIW